MFTIKPAVPEDYYEIKKLYESAGKELVLSPDKHIMVSRESEFFGVGVYETKGDYAEFTEILTSENYEQMNFFIAKAVLNSIDLNGITDVYVESGCLFSDTLKKCGFKLCNDGRLYLNLKGYFTGCSSCKN